MKQFFCLICYVLFSFSLLAEKDANKKLGELHLSWTYPNSETNQIYKIYISTNSPSSKVKEFRHVYTASGKSKSFNIDYNLNYPIYIYVTVSNCWGETIFLRTSYDYYNVSTNKVNNLR